MVVVAVAEDLLLAVADAVASKAVAAAVVVVLPSPFANFHNKTLSRSARS